MSAKPCQYWVTLGQYRPILHMLVGQYLGNLFYLSSLPPRKKCDRQSYVQFFSDYVDFPCTGDVARHWEYKIPGMGYPSSHWPDDGVLGAS